MTGWDYVAQLGGDFIGIRLYVAFSEPLKKICAGKF